MENKFFKQKREPSAEERVAEIKSSVPREEFDKFSQGDVRIGKGIEIRGEGGDRVLFIRVLPEDPEYLVLQEALAKLVKEEMESARGPVDIEEEYRWKKAGREIRQEIADLQSRDRDPYTPDVLEERVRYMKEVQATLEDYFEQLSKTRADFALDAINRWKRYYEFRAGQDKLDRFLREMYQHMAVIEDEKEFSKEKNSFLEILFYCRELQDKNAVEITIDKRTKETQ